MNEERTIRVRFAPSPTGHLHVGGARTALYNWLYARRMNGVFVLRIEDTDAQRSTRESYEGILRGMRWLGLDWDEGPDVGGDAGPYVQSLRSVLYHNDARRLVEAGMAYPCFCTPEDLEEMKMEAQREKRPPKYDGRCRPIAPGEAEERVAAGEPHVVRFRMPEEGEVRFRDVVRGELSFANADLDDFVLIKSDGRPTYNFAVVVDDAKMKITHVIRGDDHISNTPRQVHLYRALGYRIPKFAHLPMILGSDGTRLSKRHGATSIDWYRDRRYLPDALVNYLALLGWSLDGKRELFPRKTLVEKFSLKKVSKNPAQFDLDKMEWVNGEHFKMLKLYEKTMLVYAVLEEEGILPPDFDVDLSRKVDLKLVPGTEPVAEREDGERGRFSAEDFRRLALIIQAMGNRLKLLKDAPGMLRPYFKDEFDMDEHAVASHLRRPEAPERLERLAGALEGLQYFELDRIEETLRDLADEMGLQAGELIHPCRVALTGRTVSPDIFQVILVIGKEKTVERLRAAAKAG